MLVFRVVSVRRCGQRVATHSKPDSPAYKDTAFSASHVVAGRPFRLCSPAPAPASTAHTCPAAAASAACRSQLQSDQDAASIGRAVIYYDPPDAYEHISTVARSSAFSSSSISIRTSTSLVRQQHQSQHQPRTHLQSCAPRQTPKAHALLHSSRQRFSSQRKRRQQQSPTVTRRESSPTKHRA